MRKSCVDRKMEKKMILALRQFYTCTMNLRKVDKQNYERVRQDMLFKYLAYKKMKKIQIAKKA